MVAILPLAHAVHTLSFGQEESTINAYISLSLRLSAEGDDRLSWLATDVIDTYSSQNMQSQSVEPLAQLLAVERGLVKLATRQTARPTWQGPIVESMVGMTAMCVDHWLAAGLDMWTPGGPHDVAVLTAARRIVRYTLQLGAAARAESALEHALERWAHVRLRLHAAARICSALFHAYTNPEYQMCRLRLVSEFARLSRQATHGFSASTSRTRIR